MSVMVSLKTISQYLLELEGTWLIKAAEAVRGVRVIYHFKS